MKVFVTILAVIFLIIFGVSAHIVMKTPNEISLKEHLIVLGSLTITCILGLIHGLLKDSSKKFFLRFTPEAKTVKAIQRQEKALSEKFSGKIAAIKITKEITERGKQAERELKQLEMEIEEKKYKFRIRAKEILSNYLVDTKRMIKNSNLTSEEKKQFEQLNDNTVDLLLTS